MASTLIDLSHRLLVARQDVDTDPEDSPEAGKKELFTSWALFILISLLIIALFTSYFLQQRKIQAVHETVLSIFGGMIVGLIIRASPGTWIQDAVTFDYQFFFNLLLPPIILASGYELNQANFFRNIGTILTFAFAGTFLSALVLGLVLYVWALIPLEGLNITFVDAISVGATLSATDPVTILSIFNMYKVEPKLYTVIFGESILNDAVAIVVFETAQRYKPGSAADSLTLLSLFEAIGIFLLVFFGSLLIGVIVGVLTALGLKYTHVRRQPKIESCLIVLIAYASYFFSNGVHMSGIVSLLFCGITLKHYAYYNMSRRTQLSTKYLFQVLAQLSENFIFIYLGLDLFTEPNLQFNPLFIFVTVVGICIARYLSVFPLSKAVNWVIRHRAKKRGKNVADELPFSYQGMLFWAGLRGAVGVALAAGLEGENAPALRATVLVVVVLTVIIFGGTTARMLEILDIRTGVVEEVDSDDEFDIEVAPGGTYYKYDGRGIGYYPSNGPTIVTSDGAPNDTTIPLDDVGGDVGATPKSGRVSRTSNGSGGLAARKPKRPSSKLDRAMSSGSSSSLSPSPNNEIEDYDLDVDFDYDDDDLPPPASRGARSRNDPAASAPLLGSGTLPAGLQPPIPATPVSAPSPSRSTPAVGPSTPVYSDSAAAAGPSREGGRTPVDGRLFSRERLTQARTAVSHIFSGAGEGDHTAWFKQFDEDYIKPRLLLDGAEAGRKPPRGPGAV